MRPDRSTPQVIALFRGERWSGACLPREIIVDELGLPVRTVDRALAKAVRQGELVKVTSYDAGALYCLSSFAKANPDLLRYLRNDPLRSLNSRSKDRAERALQRWRYLSAKRGAHDLRPGHKCIPCGYIPHKDASDL